jgi:hypothetical protein
VFQNDRLPTTQPAEQQQHHTAIIIIIILTNKTKKQDNGHLPVHHDTPTTTPKLE